MKYLKMIIGIIAAGIIWGTLASWVVLVILWSIHEVIYS